MRFIQQTALLVRRLHNDISCQIKYSGRLYSGTKLLEIRAYISLLPAQHARALRKVIIKTTILN